VGLTNCLSDGIASLLGERLDSLLVNSQQFKNFTQTLNHSLPICQIYIFLPDSNVLIHHVNNMGHLSRTESWHCEVFQLSFPKKHPLNQFYDMKSYLENQHLSFNYILSLKCHSLDQARVQAHARKYRCPPKHSLKMVSEH
jgi:hypothetical protein